MRKRKPGHVFMVQPPSEHCPRGAAYACYCANCGKVRGIFVPCPADDFVIQMQEFTQAHKRCTPTEGSSE